MDRYDARLEDSIAIVEGADYASLLQAIAEFTARAAVARAADRNTWPQERLRRGGVSALQLFHNGRAVWSDEVLFTRESRASKGLHSQQAFLGVNELDPELYAKLDRDLRAWWRSHGYDTGSLRDDMKGLFSELERDLGDRAADARRHFLEEILKS